MISRARPDNSVVYHQINIALWFLLYSHTRSQVVIITIIITIIIINIIAAFRGLGSETLLAPIVSLSPFAFRFDRVRHTYTIITITMYFVYIYYYTRIKVCGPRSSSISINPVGSGGSYTHHRDRRNNITGRDNGSVKTAEIRIGSIRGVDGRRGRRRNEKIYTYCCVLHTYMHRTRV